MKRFLVFGGDEYYPLGGMRDFQGEYDTEDEAIDATTQYLSDRNWDCQWSSYFDCETRSLTFCQGRGKERAVISSNR